MFDDLLRAMGADPQDPDGLLGTVVKQGDKEYVLLLPIPTLFGGYVGAERSPGPDIRCGGPLVLVHHEPTAAKQRDLIETRNRKTIAQWFEAAVIYVPNFKGDGAKVRDRSREICAKDHPATCPVGMKTTTGFLRLEGPPEYRGHRDGKPMDNYLDQFCPEHRAMLDELFVVAGYVPGKWPMVKVTS